MGGDRECLPCNHCTRARLCHPRGALQQFVERNGRLLYRQDEALCGSKNRPRNNRSLGLYGVHKNAVFLRCDSCFLGNFIINHSLVLTMKKIFIEIYYLIKFCAIYILKQKYFKNK